jgi:glutamate/tyrosine decarboxylase-like PLP-dependent enzyme
LDDFYGYKVYILLYSAKEDLSNAPMGAFFLYKNMEILQKQKEEAWTIDRVREYFVDPCDAESAEELANAAFMTVKVMAEIYATAGDLSKMSSESQYWLGGGVFGEDDRLMQVMGELLMEEVMTRRFDHKFMGQIHPQGNKVGILGNLAAMYMNTNTIVKEVSISEHRMELEVTRNLAEMFGYDVNESSGNVVTGGTLANVAALWAARQKKFKELKDVGLDRRGSRLTILATEMTHYSAEKGCDMLGLNWVKVPMLENYKMDIRALDTMLANMSKKDLQNVVAVIGLAGETETGLVDDFDWLADVVEKYSVFLHADAAYGGPFILGERRGLFKGISRADSITVDPHKMMYVPYSAGAILFKDKRVHALIQKNARYLQPNGSEGILGDPELRNFGFAGRVEGSMGSGGVISTWATMRLLGNDGLKTLLDHTIELTNCAYNRVLASEVLRPVHEPELNTLLIGLTDLGLNEKETLCLVGAVTEEVFDKYGYYISCNGEVDGGRAAFRLVPMHPFTTTKEIEELISIMEKELIINLHK